MKVLLAGASGAVGQPLVRKLGQGGHEVTAIHRAPEGREVLAAAGAEPVRVDALDRAALLDAMTGRSFDAVIAELTALKKPPVAHRDMAATNRLRVEGTSNLLDVAQQCGARRFVTQSMVFGYGFGDFGGKVLTEDDTFAPQGHGRFEEHLAAFRSNEGQVLGSRNLDGIALRYGLFYGPGPATDPLRDALRRRRLPIVRGTGVLPWIYVDDAAAATVAALERAPGPGAFNIADDDPVSASELFTATASALGLPKPMVVPRWLLAFTPYARAFMMGGLRVSNRKAKDVLGWTPSVPSWREGVRRIADAYRSGNA